MYEFEWPTQGRATYLQQKNVTQHSYVITVSQY